MIPEESGDSSSPAPPLPLVWWSTGVNQAINAIVEELLFPPAITENDKMSWGRGPLSCFHARVSLAAINKFSQLFLSHSSVFSSHLTLSYWFYFFLSTSLSLAVSGCLYRNDPHKICCPNSCQQGDVEPETVQYNSRRVKRQGPTLY